MKFLLFFLFSLAGFSQSGHKEKNTFDPSKFTLEHIMDTHEWHLGDYNNHSITIPLPIILWDNGLVIFSSSKFEHGRKTVEKNGKYYRIRHEHIYKTDSNGNLHMQKDVITNESPLDFSITKNTASMMMSALLIFLLFAYVAKTYNKSTQNMPRGIGRFLEPLIVFVRDEIVIPNIGQKKATFFMPYLLTVFFFIWINNLFGLLPIPPGGGANVTGNIAVTLVLSVFTLVITNIYGNKNYWLHIFDPLGNSFPRGGKFLLYIILIPVEIIGIFTKPFALMIRLFANITAGHIIILSLTSLVFVFKTSYVSIATIPFTLFMNCMELLVAALQAYIFTLLSSLFIGMAVKEHEYEEAH